MQTMTENERHEIQETGELRLIDPQTRQEYVAVKAELYDRIKQLAVDDSQWSDDEMEALAARMFTELDNPEKIR
ncbi:MAG: hypothetical protein HY290_13910 [Planctomycetia bacterium]|nr:hypothetical protein [Planctomycetia bacterium]